MFWRGGWLTDAKCRTWRKISFLARAILLKIFVLANAKFHLNVEIKQKISQKFSGQNYRQFGLISKMLAAEIFWSPKILSRWHNLAYHRRSGQKCRNFELVQKILSAEFSCFKIKVADCLKYQFVSLKNIFCLVCIGDSKSILNEIKGIYDVMGYVCDSFSSSDTLRQVSDVLRQMWHLKWHSHMAWLTNEFLVNNLSIRP